MLLGTAPLALASLILAYGEILKPTTGEFAHFKGALSALHLLSSIRLTSCQTLRELIERELLIADVQVAGYLVQNQPRTRAKRNTSPAVWSLRGFAIVRWH